MRRFKTCGILCALVISLIHPVSVFAEEVPVQEEQATEEAESENSPYIPAEVYEEASVDSSANDSENGMEVIEYQEAKPVEETEPLENGYQYVKQQAQTTRENLYRKMGSAGNSVIYGGVEPAGNTGYMTFHAVVPSTIHGSVYLVVINTATTQAYGVVMGEINAFSQMVCLPAGEYIVNAGGVTGDAEGRYYFSAEQVYVYANTSSLYSIRLRDSVDRNRTDYADMKAEMDPETAERISLSLVQQEINSYDEGETMQAEQLVGEADGSVKTRTDIRLEREGNQTTDTEKEHINPLMMNREVEAEEEMPWWKKLLVAILVILPSVIGIWLVKKYSDIHYRNDR